MGWFTYAGSSTPSATCSAILNNGYIAINAAPIAYQCSNATGSYAWNTLGGSSFNPASPGPIGGTTPSTGAFTNLTASGTVAAGAAISAPVVTVTGTPINPTDAVTVAYVGSHSAATSLTYTPTAYNAYGDSITICVYLSAGQCYPSLIQTALAIPTLNNYAIAGQSACDVNQLELFPNDNPSPAVIQPLRSLMIGTNDLGKGAGAYEATFNTCNQASISWAAIPSNFKVLGSAAATSGTCTNDTTFTAVTGKKCTASSSTITFSSATAITTTGGPIYIWPRFIDSDAGTWTYAIDGGTAVSVNTALSPPIATTGGGTQSVGLIRVPVAAGTHSVIFTQTHSGTMSIVAIGTVPNTTFSGLPYLIVNQIPPQLNGANASVIATYNADVLGNFNLLGPSGDGLNLTWGPVGTYMQATTAAADMYDSVHPNAAGQHEVEAATLSGFKAVSNGALPSASTQFAANFPSSPYTATSSDSVILMNGGTLTLPSASKAQTIFIANISTTATLSASGGAGFGGPFILAPRSGVVATNLGSGNANWFVASTKTKLWCDSVNVQSAAYTLTLNDSCVVANANVSFPATTPPDGTSFYVYNFSPTAAITVGAYVLPPTTGGVFFNYTSHWYGIGNFGGISLPTGTPTYTAGTSVTSCGCATSYTCTNTRGRLTIVGGTATTGTICTVNFSAALAAVPWVTVNQMGAVTTLGLDHGVPTASLFAVTAAVSVTGATVTVDYQAQP
jgi:hypothetical protein